MECQLCGQEQATFQCSWCGQKYCENCHLIVGDECHKCLSLLEKIAKDDDKNKK